MDSPSLPVPSAARETAPAAATNIGSGFHPPRTSAASGRPRATVGHAGPTRRSLRSHRRRELLLDLQQALYNTGWGTAIDARDLGVDCRNAAENIDKLRHHRRDRTQLLHQRVALGLDPIKLRVKLLVFLRLNSCARCRPGQRRLETVARKLAVTTAVPTLVVSTATAGSRLRRGLGGVSSAAWAAASTSCDQRREIVDLMSVAVNAAAIRSSSVGSLFICAPLSLALPGCRQLVDSLRGTPRPSCAGPRQHRTPDQRARCLGCACHCRGASNFQDHVSGRGRRRCGRRRYCGCWDFAVAVPFRASQSSWTYSSRASRRW